MDASAALSELLALSTQVVEAVVTRPDGSTATFETLHTMSDEHIGWFKAGSALNIIRARSAS